VNIEHDLSEGERFCATHVVALERFGEAVSEQLDIVPATVRVLHHIRAKYRCPCCEWHLVTEPMPAQPIPKSLASPGLLVHIAVGKFVDGQPLYCQHQQSVRTGMTLSRTTLAMWMVRVGQLVQPLINVLREGLMSESYLLMDETTVQVLKEAGKSAESNSYLWVQMNAGPHRTVLFDYDPTRSSAAPVRLFKGFEGALHTYSYTGYDRVIEQQGLTRLYCSAQGATHAQGPRLHQDVLHHRATHQGGATPGAL
jgi:transposase